MHKTRVRLSKNEQLYHKMYKKPIMPTNTFNLFVRDYVEKHAVQNNTKLKVHNVKLFDYVETLLISYETVS